MDKEKLVDELSLDEGLRLKAYRCTKGKLTIGVGHNLDANPLTWQQLRIVGHDGRTRAITRKQAMMILDCDLRNTLSELDRAVPWWSELSDVRQRVFANMCFAMGLTRFLGFKQMLGAAQRGDYSEAAAQIMDSVWARTVGERARRLEKMMLAG